MQLKPKKNLLKTFISEKVYLSRMYNMRKVTSWDSHRKKFHAAITSTLKFHTVKRAEYKVLECFLLRNCSPFLYQKKKKINKTKKLSNMNDYNS